MSFGNYDQKEKKNSKFLILFSVDIQLFFYDLLTKHSSSIVSLKQYYINYGKKKNIIECLQILTTSILEKTHQPNKILTPKPFTLLIFCYMCELLTLWDHHVSDTDPAQSQSPPLKTAQKRIQRIRNSFIPCGIERNHLQSQVHEVMWIRDLNL